LSKGSILEGRMEMQMNFVCSCFLVAIDGNLNYLGNTYGETMDQKLHNIIFVVCVRARVRACACVFLNTYFLCAIGEHFSPLSHT
jgi:hypothetical protein